MSTLLNRYHGTVTVLRHSKSIVSTQTYIHLCRTVSDAVAMEQDICDTMDSLRTRNLSTNDDIMLMADTDLLISVYFSQLKLSCDVISI